MATSLGKNTVVVTRVNCTRFKRPVITMKLLKQVAHLPVDMWNNVLNIIEIPHIPMANCDLNTF